MEAEVNSEMAYFNIHKIILNWQPFMHKVYEKDKCAYMFRVNKNKMIIDIIPRVHRS